MKSRAQQDTKHSFGVPDCGGHVAALGRNHQTTSEQVQKKVVRSSLLSLGSAEWGWLTVTRGRPVQQGTLSHPPALYPADDRRATMPKLWKPKMSPDTARCPRRTDFAPGGKPVAYTKILERCRAHPRGSPWRLPFQ